MNKIILSLAVIGVFFSSCERSEKESIEPNSKKNEKIENNESQDVGYNKGKLNYQNLFSEVDLFSHTFYSIFVTSTEPINENEEFNVFFENVLDELRELRINEQTEFAVLDFKLSYPGQNLVYTQFSVVTTDAPYDPGSDIVFTTKKCYTEDCVGEFLKSELEAHGGCCNFKIEENAVGVTITSSPC